jgi:hypothetical protein
MAARVDAGGASAAALTPAGWHLAEERRDPPGSPERLQRSCLPIQDVDQLLVAHPPGMV